MLSRHGLGSVRRLLGIFARGSIRRLYPDHTLIESTRTWEFQRNHFLEVLGINLAIDVGANVGQWGSQFRKVRTDAQIVSFEPDIRCKSFLENMVLNDSKWDVKFIGLGEEASSLTLNLWDMEGGSSSFRPLNEEGERFTGWMNHSMQKVNVQIETLRAVFDENYIRNNRSILKIDVQGFELEVLRGSGRLIQDFFLIEIEMPLIELYTNSARTSELINFIESNGFSLVSLATERWAFPGAADCDALFVRSDVYKEIKGLK